MPYCLGNIFQTRAPEEKCSSEWYWYECLSFKYSENLGFIAQLFAGVSQQMAIYFRENYYLKMVNIPLRTAIYAYIRVVVHLHHKKIFIAGN